ncbi:hypothetical protein DPMN_045392 [Dreissena polymorpha]|uniref:Uncharacterized protein n=1 Tax=Dreissena polymorpha TaxID=45954 RepID=A0A9D4D5X3_DREPO|nr:hypothetical protein DPMN_045392 [Dreissena polymorpha]
MKAFYNRECRTFMHDNPGMSITTRDIARLTAKPFTKAFCTENIVSAFRKSGLYTFCESTITDVQTAPASIYPNADNDESGPVSEVVAALRTETDPATLFLNARKITQVVQRPKKKFVPPVKIVGNLNTEANADSLRRQQATMESKAQKVLKTAQAKQ